MSSGKISTWTGTWLITSQTVRKIKVTHATMKEKPFRKDW
jgi:hypothetical protein